MSIKRVREREKGGIEREREMNRERKRERNEESECSGRESFIRCVPVFGLDGLRVCTSISLNVCASERNRERGREMRDHKEVETVSRKRGRETENANRSHCAEKDWLKWERWKK